VRFCEGAEKRQALQRQALQRQESEKPAKMVRDK
jgi:hypothetical protein